MGGVAPAFAVDVGQGFGQQPLLLAAAQQFILDGVAVWPQRGDIADHDMVQARRLPHRVLHLRAGHRLRGQGGGRAELAGLQQVVADHRRQAVGLQVIAKRDNGNRLGVVAGLADMDRQVGRCC